MKNRDIFGTFLLAILLLLLSWVPYAEPFRMLLAAPLSLFLTGHVLLRVLGPIRVSLIEHSMYSIGVSIGICVAGGFILNWYSWLTPAGWTGWLVVVTGLLLLAAIVLRRAPMVLPAVTWPRLQGWHVAVLVLSVALTSGAWALAIHDETEQREFKFTEFWLLPKSDSGTLILGIKSAEEHPDRYDLEIAADGSIFAQWSGIEVAPGETLLRELHVGEAKKIEARLYRSDDRTFAYRRVSVVLPRKDLKR